MLRKNVKEKILLVKKVLEKYFCQGKSFVEKVFLEGKKKKLLEEENCWKKIFVRKNIFFVSEIFFYQNKFLLKKIVTDFVADFVLDKSMFFFTVPTTKLSDVM